MFNQIKDLAGGENYLITSLFMFMVFFITVTIYLLKLSKTYLHEMRNLPLEDQQKPTQNEEN